MKVINDGPGPLIGLRTTACQSPKGRSRPVPLARGIQGVAKMGKPSRRFVTTIGVDENIPALPRTLPGGPPAEIVGPFGYRSMRARFWSIP